MGYTAKNFSSLLRGRRPVKISDVVKLCRYFNVGLETFIKIEED